MENGLTMNEYQAELQEELDAEERFIADEAHEMTPAEHWQKIIEISDTLQVQVADLRDLLKDFNKSGVILPM